MTDEEKEKAFRVELIAVLKNRTTIMAATRDEIVRLLKIAQERIAIILASQPSDYQLWSLPRLKAEIERILTEFGESGAGTVFKAADVAWLAGQDLVEKPLAAGDSPPDWLRREQELRGLGLAGPQVQEMLGPAGSDEFEVWPENWPVLEVFSALSTQWRVIAGIGGVIYQGLDYAAAESVLRLLKTRDRREVFRSV